MGLVIGDVMLLRKNNLLPEHFKVPLASKNAVHYDSTDASRSFASEKKRGSQDDGILFPNQRSS